MVLAQNSYYQRKAGNRRERMTTYIDFTLTLSDESIRNAEIQLENLKATPHDTDSMEDAVVTAQITWLGKYIAMENLFLENVRKSLSAFIARITGNKALRFKDNTIEIQESRGFLSFEDVVSFAKYVARIYDREFTMEGMLDASEGSGEYRNFRLKYEDGTLTSRDSGWYYIHHGTNDWDGDYEAFCEDFDTEEEKHAYSEEFFENLSDFDPWYSTSTKNPAEIWLYKVVLDSGQLEWRRPKEHFFARKPENTDTIIPGTPDQNQHMFLRSES